MIPAGTPLTVLVVLLVLSLRGALPPRHRGRVQDRWPAALLESLAIFVAILWILSRS